MEAIPYLIFVFAVALACLAVPLWLSGAGPTRRGRSLGASTRTMLAVLSLSAAGLVGIVAREGYSGKAYPDPVHGKSVATLGYGSTTHPDGRPVKMGDTTTPVAALQRALQDVETFEGGLKTCVRVPLHQHEYDAFVSLAYNVGVAGFCLNNDRSGPSTLVRRLNAEDYAGACNAILLYDRAGPVNKPSDRCSHPDNRTCRGVWRDRLKLQAQCLGAAS
jgi:lysozyme